MRLSHIMFNRILEKEAARNEDYRKQLERNGRPLLKDARALSDESLLDKLRELGCSIDRDWLDRATRTAPSAQALSDELLDRENANYPNYGEDWVWFALTCLWERWFPDRPNLELLDDRMQAGYDTDKRNERVETARIWLRTWRDVQELMKRFGISSLEEFDDTFHCTNCAFNWVQDCSMALNRAALDDKAYARERIAFCEAVIPLAEETERDSSIVGHFRRDIAESHADLGEYESADRMYREWLTEDPQWGWGWIGWSDLYFLFSPRETKDAARAEQILREGLAVAGVRDRKYLVDRLRSIYKETGRKAEAASLDDAKSGELSLDEIIASLTAEYDGTLPEQALRAAQRRREEITPRLIELIRQATAAARAGEPPDDNGLLFAIYLLTEFRASEALPAILEAVSLPDGAPHEMFGDCVTEDLARVFAVLAEPEVVDGVIADGWIDESVRWEAVRCYLFWVRDGAMTRAEAVRRLRGHLRTAIEQQDEEIAGPLACELMNYASPESLQEIREAYRQGIADTGIVTLRNVERTIAEGDATFEVAMAECPQTDVEDAVEELKGWDAFSGDHPAEFDEWADDERDDDEWDDDEWDDGGILHVNAWSGDEWDDEPEPQPSTTIRNESPRIGRNDPCPCGSGKKHKKCCGRP
jgi:hypothetical protein